MKHLKSFGKHFLSPLSFVEMTVFMGAMALGWTVAAVVIVVWHVLRMGAMTFHGSHLRSHRFR
jgi:hypothetical protein